MQCGCRLSYCPKVCACTKKISANANRAPVLGGKGTNKIRITQTFTVKKFYTPTKVLQQASQHVCLGAA